MKSSFVVVGFVALSACGGASQPVETSTPRENFASALVSSGDLANRVESYDVTYGPNMPISGSATFDGMTSIYVYHGGGNRSFYLIGDASVTANFAS